MIRLQSYKGVNMVSLKKRVVVGIALLVLLIASIAPVGAEDTSISSPSPLTMSQMSLPVRCGNNC